MVSVNIFADFSRLIHEHLQRDSPTEANSGESFNSTNSSCLTPRQGG